MDPLWRLRWSGENHARISGPQRPAHDPVTLGSSRTVPMGDYGFLSDGE